MNVKLIFLVSAISSVTGCADSKWDSGSAICDSKIYALDSKTYMADSACSHEYELEHASIFCKRQVRKAEMRDIDYSAGGHVLFQCADH